MSQLASRIAGENRARLTLVQLLCAVSIWRTAVTRILPLCRQSAWWVTIVCLLPGFAVAALLRLAMRLTRRDTITEAVRKGAGRGGAAAVSAVLALLLLTDALSSLTALITLFTQGVGTRGTALTLALLTGGALMLSLHRDGLPRAVHFMRWPMAAAALIFAAGLLPKVRLDHLFPLHGEGEASLAASLKAGISLAWPVALLTTLPPVHQGRMTGAILPAALAPAAMLLTALTIPGELLAGRSGLAALLLLQAGYTANALKLLYLCLLMTGLFLAVGAAVHLAAEHITAPMKKRPAWISYALLASLVLLQAGDVRALWAAMEKCEPWLLLPLAAVALLALPMAAIRRDKV